jgi:hypothetical protein
MIRGTTTVWKRKTLVALSVSVLMSALVVAATGLPASAESVSVPTGQVLQLVGLGGGKCVAVQPGIWGDYDTLELPIWQQACNGAGQQNWSIFTRGFGKIGGGRCGTFDIFCFEVHYYKIINLQSNQCLNVRFGASDDGTAIEQWTCDDNLGMLWAIFDGETAGSHQLVNIKTGKCLDVTNDSYDDGAMLQLFHCTSHNEAQRYWLQTAA